MFTLKKAIFLLYTLTWLLSLSAYLAQAQDLGVKVNLNLEPEILNSYTPPFYEGKSLAGEGADIKILAQVSLATPAGTFGSSKLYYLWTINDHMSHTYSKTGGNLLIFPLDILFTQNKVNLKVYADNKLETLLAEKSLTFYSQPVTAILYKDLGNPLLTYANAMNKRYENYKVTPNESFQVIAEPFYFSTASPASSNLTYTWSVNGIPGNLENTKNTFLYTAPDKSSENFGLGLEISNSTKDLQSYKQDFNFLLEQ